MLEELVAYLDADSFTRIDSVRFEGDDCFLHLSASNYLDEWTEWSVGAKHLHGYSIEEPCGDFQFTQRDHVLARLFTDAQQDLSFRGMPSSASAVIGELLLAHRLALKDWVPFGKYLNPMNDLEGLLAGGYGKLADGPSFLMKAYAHVLEEAGIKPSLMPLRSYKLWDGEKYAEGYRELATLFVGGAYFVAAHFECSLIKGSTT